MDLAQIANYSSVISLILSVILLFFGIVINNKIKKIKSKLLFDNRIPDLIKDLGKRSSAISKLMNEFIKNEYEIKNEIALANVILVNLRKKIPKKDLNLIIGTIKTLKEIKTLDFQSNRKILNYYFFKKEKFITQDFKNVLWNCYNEINSVITEVSYLHIDNSKFNIYG